MRVQNSFAIILLYVLFLACSQKSSEKDSSINQEVVNNNSNPSVIEEPLIIQPGESRLPHSYFSYNSGSSGGNSPGDDNEDDRSFWTFCHLVTPPIIDSIAIVEMLPQDEENLLIRKNCKNKQYQGWYDYKIRVWAVVAGEGLPYDFQVFGIGRALNDLNTGDLGLATFVKYEGDWYDFDVLKIVNGDSQELNQNVPLPVDFESLSRGAEEYRQHWRERCTSDIDLNRIQNFPDDESFRKILYWDTPPDECNPNPNEEPISPGE